jgi:pimeloyl-ACP methyl ester carboxylesterase
MSQRQQTIPTSHCAIAIAESPGEGPPVLLIHGNSSCKEVFRNQMEGDIGRRYRLIAMDLPGHGRSEDARDPERTYCMSGYADAVVEVLRAVGIDRTAMLGWSLGGHIGIDMAARHDSLQALMISGTPPVGKDEVSQGFLPSEHMGLAGQEVFSEAEADAYAHATCGINAPFEDFLLEAVKRTDGRARRYMFKAFAEGKGVDQRAGVGCSPIPLAVVNGGAEPFVNNAFVESVSYANLWEGRVHILEGIGHAPFWEAPDVFDPILERFLADVTRG